MHKKTDSASFFKTTFQNYGKISQVVYDNFSGYFQTTVENLFIKFGFQLILPYFTVLRVCSYFAPHIISSTVSLVLFTLVLLLC